MGVVLTPFDAAIGTIQGRLMPAGWSPPAEQAHAFVLGSDAPGRRCTLAVGDYVEVEQTADFAGTLLRLGARLRPPAGAQAGVEWALYLRIDGSIKHGVLFKPGDPQRTLSDLATRINQLGPGAHTVGLRLALIDAPTSPCEVELPGVYLDNIVQDQTTDRLVVINRNPEPNEGNVRLSGKVVFQVLDTGSDGVDFAATSVFIDGIPALAIGGSQPGFVVTYGAIAGGYEFVVTPDEPFASDSDVEVRIVAATVGGTATYDGHYLFHTVDQTPPVVAAAMATAAKRVLITFSEPVLELDAHDEASALNPSNYVLQLLAGAPAVTPAVVAVSAVSANSVSLLLDVHVTPRAVYRVTVLGVEDLNGNAIAAPNNAAAFLGFSPPVPAGRDFDIYSFFPEKNRLEDDTGDLRSLIGCWQEVTDLLLSEIDAFGERALDPDFCDAAQLDVMLADLGNPFEFAGDLDELGKRRLVQTLVAIYREKGTDIGIIHAVAFFQGIAVTISHPQMVQPPLGEAVIEGEDGEAWVLGASTLKEKLTFFVHVPRALTDVELAQMAALLRYMKRAATRPIIVQPQMPPVELNHVVLGFSRLGVNWQLH